MNFYTNISDYFLMCCGFIFLYSIPLHNFFSKLLGTYGILATIFCNLILSTLTTRLLVKAITKFVDWKYDKDNK